MTDKELISLIGFGNKAAYNTLYNRYWEDLYAYVFAKVKDHDVTQDLLQEFWIRIWKDPSFVLTNEAQAAKGFFCKFLNFRILDYYRAVHHEIISLDNEKKNLTAQMGYSHILEDISLKDTNDLIQKVIDELPRAIKNIAKLRREGHSVSETARLLAVSEKTVRNKYSLAMAKIREKLRSSLTKILIMIT
ncbi:MAG TPA: RNA polymerase sigma factor [Niabella sp.]|nr:RNA polymerase sigma factor [Niabella sp.]